MKEFLSEMFEFNKQANRKMVSAIRDLPDKSEPLLHLSHLANCQYKWLDRIERFPEDSSLEWWSPVYDVDDLRHHLTESADQWIHYLGQIGEEDLSETKKYVGHDGTPWESKLSDIAHQLIFHCFHHRAQIQMMIRSQGKQPGFIDYIRSKQKKSGEH